jgi:hypothetical protein
MVAEDFSKCYPENTRTAIRNMQFVPNKHLEVHCGFDTPETPAVPQPEAWLRNVAEPLRWTVLLLENKVEASLVVDILPHSSQYLVKNGF